VISKGRIVAEGTVEEIRGGARLIVRATPAEQARALLERDLGKESVQVTPDRAFSLRIDPNRAGEINQRLVTAGITVTELRAGERSLEEVFMELTGTEAGH
jgi:ABC-2 type transport system ATP-binding protein